MTGGFQTQAYDQPAAFVAGDRVSNNPLFSFDAGPGGLIAGGPNGVTVGRFAWVFPPLDPNGGPQVVQNYGYGPVAGFVMRNLQAMNPTYLSNAGNVIQPGYEMALMIGGDFAVVNDGLTEATLGQKAFADLTTGKVSFAATGTFPNSASDSGGAVVNTTLTMVGGINGNILTVASVSAGSVVPGALLTSNGVGYVQPYGSGGTTGTGGAGTYLLDTAEQNVAAGTTIGGNYGVYTVGTATGTFAVGMMLSGGTTLPAGVTLTKLLTGAGGNGSTFAVNSGTGAQTSHALVGSSSVETKWYARSQGLAGEPVKISSTPLG